MNRKKSKSKVAIVTGISRGFGKEVAKVLLFDGWQVVGDGRNSKLLKETVSVLVASGPVRGIRGDVTSDSHLKSLIRVAKSLGELKLVVNNAGILGPSPLPKLANLKSRDFETVFKTNTFAPLRLIQLSLPLLRLSKGSVINITSDAAKEDYPGWGIYSATKIALEKLSSILKVEEPGVRFYSLDPGDMQTDMHQAAYPQEDISDRPDPKISAPAIVKLARGKLPSGRYLARDLLKSQFF